MVQDWNSVPVKDFLIEPFIWRI